MRQTYQMMCNTIINITQSKLYVSILMTSNLLHDYCSQNVKRKRKKKNNAL